MALFRAACFACVLFQSDSPVGNLLLREVKKITVKSPTQKLLARDSTPGPELVFPAPIRHL